MSGNDSDDIRIRISADLADISKSLQDLRRETRKTGKDAKESGRDWELFGRGLDGLRRKVTSLAAAYLSFRTVTALFRAVVSSTVEAEEATAQLEARIRSTGGAAGFTTDQLVDFANQLQDVTTFSDEAIVSLQTLLLGFTNIRGDQFTQATEAALDLATALKTDLESAATTLGRALNDPVRGLQALSRAGIQFSAAQREQIKRFVETNQLAAAQTLILKELEQRYGGAARAARNTLGGALKAVQNALGELFEASGPAVDDLTASIEELAKILRDPATIEAAANLARAIVTAFGEAVRIIAGLNIILTGAQPVRFEEEIRSLEAAIASLERRLVRMRNAPPMFTEPMVEQLAAARQELARLRLEQEKLLGVGAGGLLPRDPPAAAAGGAVTPAAIALDPRDALKELQASLAAARVLLDDEIKRLGAALDRDFEQNLVRFSDYFGKRADLERQAIEQELEQRRVALQLLDAETKLAAERGEETEAAENNRRKLVAEITALERQRADVAVNAANRQADSERQLARQLEQVRARLLDLQGDAVGARQAELQREFEELLKRLTVEGDAAGVELVNNLINVELARTRLEQLQEEYERAMTALARAEKRVQIEVDTGVISEREGRRRIIDLHRETAVEVERLLPLMRELAAATGDPAAVERIQEIELELEELGKTAKVAAREMAMTFRDAGEGALASFIGQVRSASEAWDDFVDNIRQRAAQLLSEKIFDKLFGVLGGLGGGAAGGGFAQLLAGVFHRGGVVGELQAELRRLPAIAFAGAPRFHSGGMLAADERPAILKVGEEVLTRKDPRHRLNGGAGGDTHIHLNAPDAHRVIRQSRGQLAADIATMLQRARNRNGG